MRPEIRRLIRNIWDRLEDDTTSTERLISMVADEATIELGRVIDIDQVVDAIRPTEDGS